MVCCDQLDKCCCGGSVVVVWRQRARAGLEHSEKSPKSVFLSKTLDDDDDEDDDDGDEDDADDHHEDKDGTDLDMGIADRAVGNTIVMLVPLLSSYIFFSLHLNLRQRKLLITRLSWFSGLNL